MSTTPQAPKSPLREIVQPFVDLVHAPRALWGVNLGYLIEGMVYFGIVQYLAMYFNEYVGLNDVWAGRMVGVLTAGITISMFFFGTLADRWGVRIALVAAFALMVLGRVILSAAPLLGLQGATVLSPLNLVALAAILIIVFGYGMYQPAAYSAVRHFTTPATAGMAFAMLYALMNLGGWLPTFVGPLRKAYGIDTAYWLYTGLTVVSLTTTWLILSRRTCEQALAAARAARAEDRKVAVDDLGRVAEDLKCARCGYNLRTLPADGRCPECATPIADTVEKKEQRSPAAKKPFDLLEWLRHHPLTDAKFAFFIFCLIPVQTLFAHNWLTLPLYVSRAYRGTFVGDYFETAVNLNALLIFIFTPIAAALTQKAKVYNLMITGTFIMAAPALLLALGPSVWTLFGYLVIMTIGEAIWSPRFLQYAAEIAPEGRTGEYMGVAQFPWFLTKLIVPLYSGWFLERYCPAQGTLNTETMWLVYGCIALVSPLLLFLARGWIGKDFKTRAE